MKSCSNPIPPPPFQMPVVSFQEEFQISIWFNDEDWSKISNRVQHSEIRYFASHGVNEGIIHGVFVYFIVTLPKVAYLLGLINVD